TAISTKSFAGVGSLTTLSDAQVIQLGVARASWQAGPLEIVDGGFTSVARVAVQSRVSQLQGQQLWWRLRDQPGTALISASLLNAVVSSPPAVAGKKPAPFTLWVRESDGGRPVKLSVIGVIDARSELDPGIYTSRRTAAGLGVPLDAPNSFL